MILSLLSVVLMGGLFLLMINKAKFMRTRRRLLRRRDAGGCRHGAPA